MIDPLDGTTNFAHRVPFFAVNIALAHHGAAVLGVTYEPLPGRFLGRAGPRRVAAHRWRGTALRVSTIDELGRSLLTTGFPSDRRTNPDNNLPEFNALERRTHGVRRQGSAALELAWVAAGIVEGFWHPRLKPWDAAPAGSWSKRPAGRSPSMMAARGGWTAKP